MREALHIFVKDSRQFRYLIGVLFLWLALFTGVSASPPALQPVYRIGADYFVNQIAQYAFPAMWWFLVSLVFHAEALPGDRQFWLTRPYSRASLAGAKALFVAAYVSLPLMVAQIVIAVARGLPFADLLMSVCWTQVLILAVIILPAAALAAMTATLTQFIACGLVAPLVFAVVNALAVGWGEFEWVRNTAAVGTAGAASIAVLTVQFTRRRTKTSRFIALAGVMGVLIFVRLLAWPAAFALQASLTPGSDHRISAEYVASDIQPKLTDNNQALILPFEVHHPVDTEVVCEAADITVIVDGGRSWSPRLQLFRGRTSVGESQCVLYLTPPQEFREAIDSDAASIRATLYVTVFGEAQSTVVPAHSAAKVVPRIGVCSTARFERRLLGNREPEPYTRVACTTPFRTPRAMVSLAVDGPLSPQLDSVRSYSPFPSDLRFLPETLGAWTFPESDSVTIKTREPIAHVVTEVQTRPLWKR